MSRVFMSPYGPLPIKSVLRRAGARSRCDHAPSVNGRFGAYGPHFISIRGSIPFFGVWKQGRWKVVFRRGKGYHAPISTFGGENFLVEIRSLWCVVALYLLPFFWPKSSFSAENCADIGVGTGYSRAQFPWETLTKSPLFFSFFPWEIASSVFRGRERRQNIKNFKIHLSVYSHYVSRFMR